MGLELERSSSFSFSVLSSVYSFALLSLKELNTGLPHLIVLCFVLLHRYCLKKKKFKIWGSSAWSVFWYRFSNSICSLCVSVSHFSNSFFFISIMFVMVICDHWFDVTVTLLRFRWQPTLFSNKAFLKVCTFLKIYCYCTFSTIQYSVSIITFICVGKPKHSCNFIATLDLL